MPPNSAVHAGQMVRQTEFVKQLDLFVHQRAQYSYKWGLPVVCSREQLRLDAKIQNCLRLFSLYGATPVAALLRL